MLDENIHRMMHRAGLPRCLKIGPRPSIREMVHVTDATNSRVKSIIEAFRNPEAANVGHDECMKSAKT